MAEARQHIRNLERKKAEMNKPARAFKMGRIRPVAKGPRFRFRNYLMKGLPQPPPSVDYSSLAAKSISNVYMNDQLGDCVIAGGAHYIGVATGNANGGNPVMFTNDQIIKEYGAIGGYNPNDPSTDQGCDEVTALNYYVNKGFPAGSNNLAGWVAINASDKTEVMVATSLFEGLFCGIELPDEYVNNMPQQSGFVWDVAGPPDQNNGHCIIIVGYDSQGCKIATWGMTGTMTWAAVAQYLGQADGELYAMITKELLVRGPQKAPNGFDWTQLVDDFNAMGGHLPNPPAPLDWSGLFAAKA